MEDLLVELVEQIALQLDLRSLGRFARTNNRNKAVITTKTFWKIYFTRYYAHWLPTETVDFQHYCEMLPEIWTENGDHILKIKRSSTIPTPNFAYKSFAYDRNNRFGIIGGHGMPLSSFRVTEDLQFLMLDEYSLPDTLEYRYRTLTPVRICLDDRFIVVAESAGNIIVFNKQTGEIFSEFDLSKPEDGPSIAELYFDREKIICAKNSVISLWDFETGQKINERETFQYGACTYDNTSKLCFIEGYNTIEVFDMQKSLKETVTSWYLPNDDFGDICSMKFYGNRLYCGTKQARPVGFEIGFDEVAFKYDEHNYDRNNVMVHVDQHRIIFGTEVDVLIYDRREANDFKLAERIEIGDRQDILAYSFQDSYFIVDRKEETQLYSVTDWLR